MRLGGIRSLRPDFISLRDRYRNMADNKQSLVSAPLPNIQASRAALGTDLTEGNKYNNLIDIKGAKFFDLYRRSVKIDDTDDFKEVLKTKDDGYNVREVLI